jgi:hypothetical protein
MRKNSSQAVITTTASFHVVMLQSTHLNFIHCAHWLIQYKTELAKYPEQRVPRTSHPNSPTSILQTSVDLVYGNAATASSAFCKEEGDTKRAMTKML